MLQFEMQIAGSTYQYCRTNTFVEPDNIISVAVYEYKILISSTGMHPQMVD